MKHTLALCIFVFANLSVAAEMNQSSNILLEFEGGKFIPYYRSGEQRSFVATFLSILESEKATNNSTYPVLSLIASIFDKSKLILNLNVPNQLVLEVLETAQKYNIKSTIFGEKLYIGNVIDHADTGYHFKIKIPEGILYIDAKRNGVNIILTPSRLTAKLTELFPKIQGTLEAK